MTRFKKAKDLKKEDLLQITIKNNKDYYYSRETDKEIFDNLKKENNVLIIGIPSSGKTSSAYKSIREMKKWWVAIIPPKEIEKSEIKIPFFCKNIILLFDDLDKFYLKRINELIYHFKENRKVIIVATCRSGDEMMKAKDDSDIRSLISSCKEIYLENINEEEARKIANNIGKELNRSEFNGTIGSIISGIGEMRYRYEKLNDYEKNIIHSIRVFYESGTYFIYEGILKSLVEEIYNHRKLSIVDFRKKLNKLIEDGFVVNYDGNIKPAHDIYIEDDFIKEFDINNLGKYLNELSRLAYNFWKDEVILLNLGNSYFYKEEYEMSIAKLKKAIEINPNYYEAYYNWGIVLDKLGDIDGDKIRYEEAIEKYKKAIEINPKYSKAYNNWGVVLEKLGDIEGDKIRYEEAIEKYEKAIEINLNHFGAYNNWGNALVELGDIEGDKIRYEEAIKKYKKAIEINPNYSEAYNNWGNALFKLGDIEGDKIRYEEAIEKYEMAIEINPNYSNAYYNWGNAIVKLGDIEGEKSRYKEAIKKFKISVEINPNYSEAYYNWGVALYKLGDIEGEKIRYEEAIKKYEKAIEINPNNSDAYNNWGCVLGNLGYLEGDKIRYEEAIKKYEKAIEINPNNSEAYYNWGVVLGKLGDIEGDKIRYEEAIKKFENVKELCPELSEKINDILRKLKDKI